MTKYIIIVTLTCCSFGLRENTENPIVQEKKYEYITSDELPERLKYEGEIVEAIRWDDRRGENFMIVSVKEKGQYFTSSWKSELFVYQYTQGKLKWDIKDFAANVYSKVNYFRDSFDLTDLDNNGVFEPIFLYQISPDGLDPSTLKLMYHVNDEKLAIRGVLPKHKDDQFEYRKNIDNIFESKEVYKSYASDYWDSFVEEYKEKTW